MPTNTRFHTGFDLFYIRLERTDGASVSVFDTEAEMQAELERIRTTFVNPVVSTYSRHFGG